MKRSVLLLLLAVTALFQPQRADAVPSPCIVCGSTVLTSGGIPGPTVSYAVMTGASFIAEVGAHAVGFFGSVASGTLGPAVLPAPTDFVYLYQLVNTSTFMSLRSWSISGGAVGSASGAISAGTRLESTLFVDPTLGPALITAGPVVGATATGLSVTPLVDFENGLGDPIPGPVPAWGPCLGSGAAGVNCSDGTADLLPASVLVYGWTETPSGGLLDPLWSSSVIWFASPLGPNSGSTTAIEFSGLSFSGVVPVPAPEPASLMLLGVGLLGLAAALHRKSG